MAAANDANKKTTVHELDVRVINGQNVYMDDNGNIVRVEKHKDKKKSFAAAQSKLESQMPENRELSPADIMAMGKQND